MFLKTSNDSSMSLMKFKYSDELPYWYAEVNYGILLYY